MKQILLKGVLLLALGMGVPAGIFAINEAPTADSKPVSDAMKKPALGGDFILTDHHGEAFDFKQLRGKLVLIFFGYTFCPDVCPTELSLIGRVYRALGDDADKIAALFISVDPERDTPEKLKQYVAFFHPSLIGLTGTLEEVNQVADAYQVQRKIHEKKPGSSYYLVDHSANLFLVGRDGKLTNMIPYGLPGEHVLEIIRQEINTQFTQQDKEKT